MLHATMNLTQNHNIVIFGGTFDPIHYGHLNISTAVQDFFNFESFIFLPCKIQVLKNTIPVNQVHRVTMLELACENYPKKYNFLIDSQEISRKSPSYMVLTLRNYRKKLGPNVSITLMLGVDSFNQLSQWYQWRHIISLANLLVIHRPGYIPAWNTSPNGVIDYFNAGEYAISSTKVRQELANRPLKYDKIPTNVYDYIVSHNLYTSSAER